MKCLYKDFLIFSSILYLNFPSTSLSCIKPAPTALRIVRFWGLTGQTINSNDKNRIKSTLSPTVSKHSQHVASTLGYRPCEFDESASNITETVISLCIVGLTLYPQIVANQFKSNYQDFVLVKLVNDIVRNYDVTDIQYKFLSIKCPLCDQKFIFEPTFLHHLSYIHFDKPQSGLLRSHRSTVCIYFLKKRKNFLLHILL